MATMGIYKKILYVSVLLLLLVVKIKIINAQEQCVGIVNRTVPHLGLNETNFWSAKSQDLEQCAKLCVRRKICLSITYDTKSRMCELNAGTRADTSTKTGESLVYSEFKWWPSILDKNCYSRPCNESETCIPKGLVDQTDNSSNCAYSCMIAARKVCPLPSWGVSHGRTVGSVNVYTCGKGTIGGGIATCLPSKQWDNEIDTTCNPILAHPCSNDTLCSHINGHCSEQGRCECEPPRVYIETNKQCELKCEAGWELFDGRCYLFNTEQLSWVDANTTCIEYGSGLLKIEDMKENDFVLGKCIELENAVRYFWIGARYSIKYKEYRWYDDTAISYSVWGPEQPDLIYGCVDLLKKIGWKWNDHYDCFNTTGASICEKSI